MVKKNQNSIVGSGFIAKNFIKYEEFFSQLGVYAYAAGVSNSLCEEKELFIKDKNRLNQFSKTIEEDGTLLYFSTCSIDDPSRNKNFYIQHKLDIENFIKKNFKKFLIIRLSEVVGKSTNTNTLVNFFFDKIKKKEKFDLWADANRSIIDIEDVVKILIDFLSINKKITNQIINIANPKMSTAFHIVKILENITQTKAKYNMISKGEKNWNINTSAINDSLKRCDITFKKDYLENLLKKYFN
tara:strand:+ start:717 stop:1442 length:726 start_codon:yes stop_codon:yes gene_type:complete